jgi:hypothetical protein
MHEVAPQANGKEIVFNAEAQFYAPSWYNPYSFDYANSTYTIDRIIIFDATGELCSTGGWFTSPGFSDNPYKQMALMDGGKLAKVSRKSGSASAHFEKGEPFIQTRGRDYSRALRADLYIPVAYLDALGWKLVEKTHRGEFQTFVEVKLEAGYSDGSSKRPLFELHYHSETIKHFELTKKALIETLQNATTAQEVETVIDEFKWKF